MQMPSVTELTEQIATIEKIVSQHLGPRPSTIYPHIAPIGMKGKDIPSASALRLLDGSYFDVTGTTTITSISVRPEGDIIILQFDGALTLTHNATNLILQGAANLTTAAGDIIVLVSEGNGNWREVSRGNSSLSHDLLDGVSANDHHNQSHVLATNTGLGPDHTMSGATAGQVLRASSATAAAFAQLGHGDLGSVTTDQHHTENHSSRHATGGADTLSGVDLGTPLGVWKARAAGSLVQSLDDEDVIFVAADGATRTTFIVAPSANGVSPASATMTIAQAGAVDLLDINIDARTHRFRGSATTIMTITSSTATVAIAASTGLLDLSAITAGRAVLKITATSDVPVNSWSAGAGVEVTAAPLGWLEIDVGGAARYIPFWS